MRAFALLCLVSISVTAVVIPPLPPPDVVKELAKIAQLFDTVEAGWKEANGAIKAFWEQIEPELMKGLPVPNQV